MSEVPLWCEEMRAVVDQGGVEPLSNESPFRPKNFRTSELFQSTCVPGVLLHVPIV